MDWKPDGSAVVYNAGENGGIRCVPVGGGTPVVYTANFLFVPI